MFFYSSKRPYSEQMLLQTALADGFCRLLKTISIYVGFMLVPVSATAAISGKISGQLFFPIWKNEI